MAVTVTNIYVKGNLKVVDITATADGDTTATIPHGMGNAAVKRVTLTSLLQAVGLLSGWAVTTQDATNIVLTKSTAVGSGNAGAQLRVYIEKLAG